MGDENQVLDQTQQEPAVTAEQVPTQEEGQVEQANPGQHAGIQKRFDELTAKRYEEQRRADALEAQLRQQQEMTARLMAAMAERAAPPQPDPAADLSPEDRRRIEALVAPKVSALEQRLAQTMAQLERQQFDAQLKQETPAVASLAQDLMRDWRRQGLNGWTMEDAIVFARGRLAGQDGEAAARARNERGQYIAGSQNVVRSQSAPPPPVAPRADQGLPANFDRLSASEQADILEKRLEGKFF